MKRRTTKEIAESIRRGSKLVFQSDVKYRQAGFIAPLNPDRLEYAVAQENVECEDYYLMALVYDACFATPEFLYYRIKSGAVRKERECMEIARAGLLESLSLLNRRLERLACLGFFFCYETPDGEVSKTVRIFYCSMEGFRAFTHRLERRMSYNRTLVYRPMHEVFRYLATNVVLYSMRENPYFRRLWSFERFELDRSGEQKPVQEDVYGRILFQKPDSGHKVYLIVEPVFFRIDGSFITKEENDKHIVDRLAKMEQIVESFNKADDSEAFVLFLVEDGNGLHKLQDIISGQDLSFFVERCFYTSENTIFDSARKGGDGTDSLLGIMVGDGKIVFRQRNLPVSMGEDCI